MAMDGFIASWWQRLLSGILFLGTSLGAIVMALIVTSGDYGAFLNLWIIGSIFLVSGGLLHFSWWLSRKTGP